MRALACLAACLGCQAGGQSPAALQNRGVVTVDSHSWKSGTQTYGQGTVAAAFVREQTDPFLGCQRRSFGACSAHFDCQPVRVDTPDLATSPDLGVALYASAGDISVQGLGTPVTLLLMTTGMFAGQYNVFQQYMPLFSGGEVLQIRAAGGEVPAFSAQVTAPASPVITSPSRGAATVSRMQDLSLAWTGGGAGELRVSLSVSQMTGTSGIDCAFPASLGAAAVPKAALQMLPAGSGLLSLSAVAESDLFTGGWQVSVTATTGTLDSQGGPSGSGRRDPPVTTVYARERCGRWRCCACSLLSGGPAAPTASPPPTSS